MKIKLIKSWLLFILLLLQVNSIEAQSLNEIIEAEKAYNDGKWTNATKLYETLTRINAYNGMYWFRLGSSYYNLKQYEKSTQAYLKSIELGQSLGYSMYNIACNYALQNNAEQAVAWLIKASGEKHGYNQQSLLTDTDFDSIRESDVFKKILAPAVISGITREESWKKDLSYFDSQMRITHFNLFHTIYEETWNKGINTIRDQITQTDDIHLNVLLMKLASQVEDGHTSVYPSFGGQNPYHLLPIRISSFVEGDFIISSTKNYSTFLGAKILKINDTSIEDVKKQIGTILPIEKHNEQLVKSFGTYYLICLELLYGLDIIDAKSTVKLLIEQNNEIREITFSAPFTSFTPSDIVWGINKEMENVIDSKNLPLYLKNSSEVFWYDYNPKNKLIYCQINQIKKKNGKSLGDLGKELRTLIDKKDVEVLVLDLRFNTGGNGFLNQDFVNEIIKCEQINTKGKLFTIIGPTTFSAAMLLSSELWLRTQTLFVGTPTGSSPNHIGDDNPHILPYSGLIFSASNAYWQSQSSYDFRKWIAPDIIAEPSFELLKQKRDPAMEAILKVLD